MLTQFGIQRHLALAIAGRYDGRWRQGTPCGQRRDAGWQKRPLKPPGKRRFQQLHMRHGRHDHLQCGQVVCAASLFFDQYLAFQQNAGDFIPEYGAGLDRQRGMQHRGPMKAVRIDGRYRTYNAATAERLQVSAMHFMREIMKLPVRDTLFIKMGYDFPNIPPRYFLLHNPIVLNTVHDASTSQRYSGSVASKHRAIPACARR